MKKKQKEKVFCKDCAFLTDEGGFLTEMCMVRKEVFDYVLGKHKTTIFETPQVKNKNGLCKDFKDKVIEETKKLLLTTTRPPITLTEVCPIRCEKCKRNFVCQQALVDHLKDSPKHKVSPITCSLCKKGFETKDAFWQHCKNSPKHNRLPYSRILERVSDFLCAVIGLLVILGVLAFIGLVIFNIPVGG